MVKHQSDSQQNGCLLPDRNYLSHGIGKEIIQVLKGYLKTRTLDNRIGTLLSEEKTQKNREYILVGSYWSRIPA